MAKGVFTDVATTLCLTTLMASNALRSLDATAYDYRRGHPASAFALLLHCERRPAARRVKE